MKNKRFAKIATLVLAAALLVCCVIGIGASAEENGATEVSIAGKNLSYEGALKIVYYVDAPNFDAENQTLKMNFWIGTKSETPAYVKEFEGEGDIVVREGKTYYAIFSDDIAPVDMTKPIFAQPFIVNSDETEVVCEEVTEYSVYTYAMNRFSQSPTADQLALYTALLDYGAAVQSIFPDDANVDVYGWADAYYDITKYVFVDDVLQADESLARGTAYRPSELTLTDKGLLLGLANSTLDGAYFKNITDIDGVPVDVQYALPGTYTYNVNYTTAGTLNDYNSATDVNTLFIPTGGVNQYKVWWSGNLSSLNEKSETGTYMLFENGYVATGTNGAGGGGWQIDINNGTNLPVAAGVTYVVAFDFKIADMVEVAGNDGHIGWFGVSYTQNGYWSAQSDANQGIKAYIASIDPYIVSGKTYMGQSSNVVPNGEWFNLRTEVEIVSVDNASTADVNEAKSIVRIYTDGVLALTYEVNMAKSPESLHLWLRDKVAKAEYCLDNLYVNSYAPSNTKGAGSYNNGSASADANKVNADGVTDIATVITSANGFELNNKKAHNALYVNEKGEIVAKTEDAAGAVVLAGPDNKGNDGEKGVKYIAELDLKISASAAEAGAVIGTLTIYSDAEGQNKIASVDVVKNADGTASIGNKVINPNTWYNIRLEYTIVANGFKIDNAVSFDGTLNVYVFTDLAYTAEIDGDVDNRTFGSFGYAQSSATSSVTLDNLCFDYVALAGTKGNGAYYKQHVENAAKDVATAEQFIDFTGKTSVTDNAFKSAGGSIHTNNWNTADPRWILMTGAEAMMFGGNVWSETTATLTSAVTAAEGEKIVVEFDYLFYGADGAGNGSGGNQYIEFKLMNGSTSVMHYKFYNTSSGKGFRFAPSDNQDTYVSGTTNKWYNIRIEITYGAAGSTVQVYVDNVKAGAARTINADASSITGLYLQGRPAVGPNANSLFDNFVIDNTSKTTTSSYYGQYNAGMLTDAVAYDADATTNVGEIFSNPSYKFVNVNKRPANGTAGNYVLVEDGAVVVGTGSGFNYPSYLKVNLDFADIAVGSKIVAEYDYQFVSSTDYLNTGSAIITNVGFTKTNSQDDTNFNSLDMWTHYYVGSSWVNPDDNVGSNGTVTMTPGTWYKLRVEIDVTETGIVKTYFVDGVQKYQETFTGVTVNSIGGFVMKFTRNVDVQENKYDNFVFAVIPPAAE